MVFPSAVFHSLSNSGFEKCHRVGHAVHYRPIYVYRPSMCGVYTHCAACALRQWVSGCYIISHIGYTMRPAIVNAIH